MRILYQVLLLEYIENGESCCTCQVVATKGCTQLTIYRSKLWRNQHASSRGNQVTKVDIPVVEGIDVSDYKTIKKSVDYFFDIPDGCPKYIANVDETGWGLLQISTDRLRSRNLFSWGNQDACNRWQEYLDRKSVV